LSILAVLLLALPVPSARAGEAPPAFRHALLAGHPLAGRIWRVSDRAFISVDDAVAAALAAEAVLLGETHDNVDHHFLQTWMLRQLTAAGRRPLVAFEMIDQTQSDKLREYLAAHPRDAADLGEAVGWASTGWPDWAHYRPIAQAAMDGGAPVAAANIPRETVRTLAKGDPSPELLASYGLDQPLPPAVQAEMEAEIRTDHCGLLPESAIPRMTRVQRARDAKMAEVLAEGLARLGSAVLIAGSGHIRSDRGVPARLAQVAPGRRVLALAFFEVQEEVTDPARYGESLGSPLPPYDIVWFTPRADRQDPCEEWRKKAGK
jgi:uncharacterized iron-regulated protein